jgi:hypothetical protein
MSPIDHMSIKQYQLIRFKGSNYEKVGDLLSMV